MKNTLIHQQTDGPWDLHIYKINKNLFSAILWHSGYELATVEANTADEAMLVLDESVMSNRLNRLMQVSGKKIIS